MSMLTTQLQKLGVIGHASNPSTLEAEVEELLYKYEISLGYSVRSWVYKSKQKQNLQLLGHSLEEKLRLSL